MSNPQIVIVLFAGRSGSKTLTKILNDQENTIAIWENTGFVEQAALNKAQDRLDFLRRQPFGTVVDIDYRWLWNLDHVIRDESIKIVYLERDPELITESFMKYLIKPGDYPLIQYPFFDFTKNRNAILRSVSRYQADVMKIGEFCPGRIMRVTIGQLNNPEKVDALLDWIGTPKTGRVITKHHVASWGEKKSAGQGEDIESYYDVAYREYIDILESDREDYIRQIESEREDYIRQDDAKRQLSQKQVTEHESEFSKWRKESVTEGSTEWSEDDSAGPIRWEIREQESLGLSDTTKKLLGLVGDHRDMAHLTPGGESCECPGPDNEESE